jgi:hypothetical protein
MVHLGAALVREGEQLGARGLVGLGGAKDGC